MNSLTYSRKTVSMPRENPKKDDSTSWMPLWLLISLRTSFTFASSPFSAAASAMIRYISDILIIGTLFLYCGA